MWIVCWAADATERDADDVVEDALEIVEEDGIGGALEDESELYMSQYWRLSLTAGA
jgi:hypothetical protein